LNKDQLTELLDSLDLQFDGNVKELRIRLYNYIKTNR